MSYVLTHALEVVGVKSPIWSQIAQMVTYVVWSLSMQIRLGPELTVVPPVYLFRASEIDHLPVYVMKPKEASKAIISKVDSFENILLYYSSAVQSLVKFVYGPISSYSGHRLRNHQDWNF